MLEAGWDDLDGAFEALEAELTPVVRGLAVEIWNDILRWTPQFYGRMAASWTFNLNSPVFVDRSEEVSPEGLNQDRTRHNKFGEFMGLRRGAPTAINIAQLFNVGNDRNFKLGDTIWIANGVDHGEGPYAGPIEEGAIPLRPANRPGAPVRRALDAASLRYADVPPVKVQYLKSLNLGVRSA